ncbi:MAG: hypothetical protein RBR67_05420 [Desulfobacterium sp.]|jgi:hypothetical protein|nr:hypothetical protein [Desulfobacterium sp.]
MPDGQLKPLTRHKPATKVENGRQGAISTIDFIARQWASPSVKEQRYQIEATLENRQNPDSNDSVKKPPGLSILPHPPMGSSQNYALDQASDLSMGQPMDEPMDLGMFLNRLKTHMFSISCMVFQDAWNLDLERVQDCCIHVFSPDGRLIPFCMYNLTDVNGRSLYRKGSG